MGANQSAEKEKQYQAELERLKTKAKKLYVKRLNEYNYALHGDYNSYLYTIDALYDLECIPEYLRYGNKPK
jgi:hypothetical protein